MRIKIATPDLIAYVAMAVATFFIFQAFGAWVETHIPFFEHSSTRRILYPVIRTEDNVCWTHEFDKYKPGRIERLNYHLSDDLGNVEAVTPMRAKNTKGNLPSPPGLNTGEPPKISEETPVGNNIQTSFCIPIPSWGKDSSTLTVFGEIGYDGPKILGFPLWKYTVDTPQITFFPNRKPGN